MHAIFSTMVHNMPSLDTHLQTISWFLQSWANAYAECIHVYTVLPRADVKNETLTDAHTIDMRNHSMH